MHAHEAHGQHHAERHRRRRLYGMGWAWTLLALATCALMAARGHGVGDRETWLLLALASGVLSNLTFELSPGRRPIWYCPDSQPAILASIFLTPLGAMLSCIGPLTDLADRRERVEWWKTALRLGTALVASGCTAVVVHKLLDNPPSSQQVLATAIVAAVCFELVQAAGYAVLFEARKQGGGAQFLASLRSVSPVNVGINALAVVLVAPFVEQPVIALLVLSSFQAVTWMASRLSTSENRLRERSEHLHDMFSRYVPSHVAEQLAAAGESVRLGGEQREVTVLFCDVRGFTSWSEQVPAETVITELNSLLASLSEAVMATDGTLDKFTGDGLMAFWGAPLDQPDHADRALTAGLDMLTRLDSWNAERTSRGLPGFAIGVGLHSGHAIVGNVGHESRLEYTAIGDTVNTAARIESATKDVGAPLLLSDAVHSRLGPSLQEPCLLHGTIAVKGREQPVEVLTVRAAAGNGRPLAPAA